MQRKQIIFITAIVIILLLIGAYFFIFRKESPAPDTNSAQNNQNIVKILSPSDVGLTIKASPDSKKIQFTIGDISDIKDITYQLTYDADSTVAERSEGGEARIQRGITGDAELKSGDKSYISPWLDLGSCSKSVCRYDKGVNKVDLLIKITKNNAQVYSLEDSLEL